MVVGFTHASFKRLASEPNGTVITPGRSDAFPYRFQEVAVATATSTYTCIISSQPRSMAAQDIDCIFFLEIYNITSGEGLSISGTLCLLDSVYPCRKDIISHM